MATIFTLQLQIAFYIIGFSTYAKQVGPLISKTEWCIIHMTNGMQLVRDCHLSLSPRTPNETCRPESKNHFGLWPNYAPHYSTDAQCCWSRVWRRELWRGWNIGGWSGARYPSRDHGRWYWHCLRLVLETGIWQSCGCEVLALPAHALSYFSQTDLTNLQNTFVTDSRIYVELWYACILVI